MNRRPGDLTDDQRWRQAVGLAARRHRGQMRRDGITPYVAHVYRVAMNVRHVFGCDDPIALAAALLHDTIEDTTSDFDEVAWVAGVEVAEVVAAMTKNMLLPEAEREADYDLRLAQADWRARLIKLADVLDNLLDSDALGPAAHQRMLDRCHRAIALAEHDQGPCFERALAAIHQALASEVATRSHG